MDRKGGVGRGSSAKKKGKGESGNRREQGFGENCEVGQEEVGGSGKKWTLSD